MEPITTEIVSVTPEIAAAWLAANTRNRNLADTTVSRYAGAMTRGEWRLTGAAIQFGRGGVLLDGQHRLAAVVRSGIAIDFLVIRGIDDGAINVIDTGRKRSLADRLKMMGEPNANVLAAAVTVHCRMGAGGSMVRAGTNSITIDQGLAHLEKHPGLRDAVRMGEQVRRHLKGPGGTYAALLYETPMRSLSYRAGGASPEAFPEIR